MKRIYYTLSLPLFSAPYFRYQLQLNYSIITNKTSNSTLNIIQLNIITLLTTILQGIL